MSDQIGERDETLLPWPSLPHAIRAHSEARPDAAALIHFEPGVDGGADGAAIHTYRDLAGAIDEWSAILAELGARKDGAVAMLLRNTPAHYALMLGSSLVSAGMSLNPLLSVDHLAELLIAAGADVVAMPRPEDDAQLWQLGQRLIAQSAERRQIAALEVGRALSPDMDDLPTGSVQAAGSRSVESGEPAAWFHTGGTTGAPKLVRHTHSQHVLAAAAFADAAQMTAADRLGNGLPLFHVAGAICSTRAVWLSGGCVINLSEQGFRNRAIVERYWEIVGDQRMTIGGGVPTAVGAVLERPLNSDVRSLRCGYAGGSPCSPALQERFEQVTGRPLHVIYGMTEGCGVIAVGRADRPAPRGIIGPTVGCVKLAIRGTSGTDLSETEIGEIWISGPTIVATDPGALIDGWMPTGDCGMMTEAGLAITGRVSDLIIRSGHNIDPAIIEEAALATGAIAAAAAVGMPDAYAGEVPVLFAVRRADASIGDVELAAMVAAAIPDRVAQPREVFWVPELPMTAVGKISRRDLRADAIARMVLTEIALRCGRVWADLEVQDPQGIQPRIRINWQGAAPPPESLSGLRAWARENHMELI